MVDVPKVGAAGKIKVDLSAEAPPPKPVEARETKFQDVQFFSRSWVLKAPPEATKEDPLRADFWKKISRQLTRHDIIRILADDESWEMHVVVEAVYAAGAVVKPYATFGRQGVRKGRNPLNDEYFSEYRGGEGWCVVRTRDDHIVIRGHSGEEAARMQWAREQPRKMT